MKFALVSDSTDALIGMRLAGIEGVRVSTRAEAQAAFRKFRADENIGILLMTAGAVALCPEAVEELKAGNRPVPVCIPDSDGRGAGGDTVTQYIREAIGIKL